MKNACGQRFTLINLLHNLDLKYSECTFTHLPVQSVEYINWLTVWVHKIPYKLHRFWRRRLCWNNINSNQSFRENRQLQYFRSGPPPIAVTLKCDPPIILSKTRKSDENLSNCVREIKIKKISPINVFAIVNVSWWNSKTILVIIQIFDILFLFFWTFHN